MSQLPNLPAPPQDTIGALQAQIAELVASYESLKQSVAKNITHMPDNPVYECAEPFYSPDDVYYPAGAQFEDITGRIVPNEHMIPMNPAAEQRVRAYLDSLPGKQRTPSLDNIVEAAMKLRPKIGDDPNMIANVQAAMVAEAFKTQHGMNLSDAAAAEVRPLPKKLANVPMMSNSRINTGTGKMGATRLRQDAIPAALRTTRVMGGVQSNPLGTEQAGVTAQ